VFDVLFADKLELVIPLVKFVMSFQFGSFGRALLAAGGAAQAKASPESASTSTRAERGVALLAALGRRQGHSPRSSGIHRRIDDVQKANMVLDAVEEAQGARDARLNNRRARARGRGGALMVIRELFAKLGMQVDESAFKAADAAVDALKGGLLASVPRSAPPASRSRRW
jgi:hypothetical protein